MRSQEVVASDAEQGMRVSLCAESVGFRGLARASIHAAGGRLHLSTSCRDSFHDLKPANLILVDVEHIDIGVQAPGCAPGETIGLLQGLWQLWVDVARHYPALEIPFGGDRKPFSVNSRSRLRLRAAFRMAVPICPLLSVISLSDL